MQHPTPRLPTSCLLRCHGGGLGLVFLVQALSAWWIGMDWHPRALFIAPLLSSAAYAWCVLPLAHRGLPWQVLPAVLLLVFTLAFDLVFALLGRSLSWSDATLGRYLPEILGWPLTFLVLLVASTPVLLLVGAGLRSWRAPPTAVAAAVLVAGLLLCSLRPAWPHALLAAWGSFQEWDEARNISENGRLACFLHYGLMRDHYRRSLAEVEVERPLSFSEQVVITEPRNVHILVLESFVDLRACRALRCATPLFPPALAGLLGEPEWISSPVFGGLTPQAEFELLCGVPAMAQLASVECNVFTGAPTWSLARWLGANGYRCTAAMATTSTYYNARRFYDGLGFASLDAPDRPDSTLFDASLDWRGMSDTRFLADRSADLVARLASGPLFTYAVGMDGHYPFLPGPDCTPQPTVCWPDGAAVGADLQDLVTVCQQRYHALLRHLTGLLANDPEALVLILADHRPPLDLDTWDRLGCAEEECELHLNPVYAFDRGRRVRLGVAHYHEIPHRLRQLLCGTPMPERDRAVLARDYRTIMARAAR